MKRAVILHGTDGKPTDQWFNWLKRTLEQAGYQVFAPTLPNNHTPNRKLYERFLRESDWDFNDNLIVGHSSGATTVLNLLSSTWFPHIKAAVLVGTFLNEKLTKDADWYEPGQFDDLFTINFDINELKRKASAYYFVHGDNDPFCDIDDARALCQQLGGKFITIKNGHHLGGTSQITELPDLERALRKDKII